MGYGKAALDLLNGWIGNILPLNGKMLELGSQDINHDVPLEDIRRTLLKIQNDTNTCEKIISDYFSETQIWKVANLFRCSQIQYEAIDALQGEFIIQADLNTLSVTEDSKNAYDLITNFGITEHVTDQVNVFRVIHDYLKPGGYCFHNVPFTGYFNYGLYNYHPIFFLCLSRANEYEISWLHLSPPHLEYNIPILEWLPGSEGWKDVLFQSGITSCMLKKIHDKPFTLFTDFDRSVITDKENSNLAKALEGRYDLRVRNESSFILSQLGKQQEEIHKLTAKVNELISSCHRYAIDTEDAHSRQKEIQRLTAKVDELNASCHQYAIDAWDARGRQNELRSLLELAKAETALAKSDLAVAKLELATANHDYRNLLKGYMFSGDDDLSRSTKQLRNRRIFYLRSHYIDSFQLSIPATMKPDIYSCFAFSLPKAGSNLLRTILNNILAEVGMPIIDLFGESFKRGLNWNYFAFEDGLFVPRGYCYGVFTNVPSWLPLDKFHESPKLALIRDPRDMIVSLYYSLAHSHPSPGGMDGVEEDPSFMKQWHSMVELSRQNSIDAYARKVVLGQLLVWHHLIEVIELPEFKVIRYEDVIYEKQKLIDMICDHFGVNVPESFRIDLAERVNLIPKSEDVRQHIRRVHPGEHKAKLKPETIAYLNTEFADILDHFNYIR